MRDGRDLGAVAKVLDSVTSKQLGEASPAELCRAHIVLGRLSLREGAVVDARRALARADVMLEVWQVAKSHCVERDGKKSNRGWKKVRISERGGEA